MKMNKFASVVLAMAAMAMTAGATVTINTQFGVATDKDGVAIPDGTLWALIVDSGSSSTATADGSFAGVFGLNSSIKSGATEQLLATTFGGKSLSIGSVFNGDTIFALGGFNGFEQGLTTGAVSGASVLTLGQNGVTANANFAFLFFPGVQFTTVGATYTIGTQVGGVSNTVADGGAGTGGLTIPTEGNTLTVGANTNDPNLGGSYPAAGFQAVAIPEPSAALLGAVGALGLLRRRRN